MDPYSIIIIFSSFKHGKLINECLERVYWKIVNEDAFLYFIISDMLLLYTLTLLVVCCFLFLSLYLFSCLKFSQK